MEHNQTPRDVPSPSPEQQHCPSPSGEIPPAKPTAKERETEEKEKGIKKVKEGEIKLELTWPKPPAAEEEEETKTKFTWTSPRLDIPVEEEIKTKLVWPKPPVVLPGEYVVGPITEAPTIEINASDATTKILVRFLDDPKYRFLFPATNTSEYLVLNLPCPKLFHRTRYLPSASRLK